MRRREFIGLVGGATLAWSLGARAQEPGRVYRLALVLPVGRDEPASLAFLDELRSQGFVEGKNLVIVGGLPTGNEQAAAVVPLILQTTPDAIVTGGDFIARAFQKATKSIPLIVMTEDMVAAGFAASLAQPGGKYHWHQPDVLRAGWQTAGHPARGGAKRGPHRRACRFQCRKFGIPEGYGGVSAESRKGTVGSSCRKRQRSGAGDKRCEQPRSGRAQCVVITNAASQPSRHHRAHGGGGITGYLSVAGNGRSLLGYGPSFIDIFRQRAGIVAKVFRGAKPEDLPIEQPTKFKLVVNLKTAKTINYAVPTGLMLRADKVIE